MEKEGFKNVFVASGDPEELEELCSGLETIGLPVAGRARSVTETFRELVRGRADLLVADYILSDGDALELCQKLRTAERSPTAVVLLPYINGFLSSRLAQAAPDCFLLKPVSRDRLAKTIRDFSGYRRSAGSVTGVDPERRVAQMLCELGIPAKLMGHRYIYDALLSVSPGELRTHGAMDELYKRLSELHGSTPARVERNIRNAVEAAFDRCTPETLEKYFGNTVSFGRGKPTNGELLSCLAEKLALEAKGI